MDVKRLILMGGLGVVALVGFLQLQKLGTPPPVAAPTKAVVEKISSVEYVDILTASMDIPLGTRLNGEKIKWKKWPAEALSDSYIDNVKFPTALDDFKQAVTRTAIYMGEPILAKKVVHAGDRGQMSAILKPGMRGTSVRISQESAAGGFIQPGDRVDVVLTSTGATPDQTIASTVFENVGVLAIGKVHTNTTDGTAYVNGTTALLEMSQTDSEILIEAQSKGELSLILRGLDRRKAGTVPSSAAVNARKNNGKLGSITIYRAGQPQQVAVQGN